jgi:hypothetical protein
MINSKYLSTDGKGSKCCCCCCFSKDTIILVKENNNIVKKPISDIKKDDFILTLINGEKKFTKVKATLFDKSDDGFLFYQFKCRKDDKVKSITVTRNHIMMAYNKDKSDLKFKLAENIVKNEDYFYTLDGLYEIYEINTFNMKIKYDLKVDEKIIIADEILVTCLDAISISKQMPLDDMIENHKLVIL